MRALAVAHGEAGWQAHTFPLSVDGIEIVASLVLLADRRAGRRWGWLPWAALVAGTTASLAANVAAADADVIGRVVAGGPAFALLVAVKLCSRLLGPRSGGDGRPVLAAGDRDGGYARPPMGGKRTAAVAGGGPVAGRDAPRHVPAPPAAAVTRRRRVRDRRPRSRWGTGRMWRGCFQRRGRRPGGWWRGTGH